MAVINVMPLTDLTELIASDNVNAGDVLLLEEGIYFQTVIVRKDNIRIIAKGPGVIFDGRSTLITGFILSNVTGVVIDGIHIKHYRANGIEIDGGSGNRIINNNINNTMNVGILISNSVGNLIWKNEVCRCSDGIMLALEGSSNNWMIENTVKECLDDGFDAISATENNNAFISNKAVRNRFSGFDVLGNNNLLLNNLAIDNNLGMTISAGSSTVAIGNKIEGSRSDALTISFTSSEHFVGENHVTCNRQAGIFDQGLNGMSLNNEVSYNGNSGFFLASNGALIMGNRLVCNIPENITDLGTGNIFINNAGKPCEPCEAPGVVCGDCPDGADKGSNHPKAGERNGQEREN